MHHRTYLMQVHRAQEALAVYLTIQRNPNITTTEICAAFGFGDRTLQRRVRALRACGCSVIERRSRVSEVAEWTAPRGWRLSLEPCPEDPVLWRWLRRAGTTFDLTALPHGEKIQWYKEIVKLMMVGTPPFSPTDYVNVAARRGTMTITLPKGRSVSLPEVRQYRRPAYATD